MGHGGISRASRWQSNKRGSVQGEEESESKRIKIDLKPGEKIVSPKLNGNNDNPEELLTDPGKKVIAQV